MKFRLLILLFICCISYIMGGCNKIDIKPTNQEQGTLVKVPINFTIPKFIDPDTKSVDSSTADMNDIFSVVLDSNIEEQDQQNTKAADKPLYNLWIFQFDKDGKKRKVLKVSTTDIPINEKVTIEADLFTGTDQTIYLLSLGKQYGDIDLSSIESLTQLESTTFDFVRYENGMAIPIIKEEDDVPYRGSCSGVTIIQLESGGAGYIDYKSSLNFNGSIRMKALVSQVSFDCSYEVFGLSPYSLQMSNVPTSFVVNDATFKPTQFVSLPVTLFEKVDFGGGKRYSASWYVAPNSQGSVAGMKETDRYYYYKEGETTPTGKAPADGTYLNFWASVDAIPNRYALYYIFLGGNTSDDFNILPHSHYKYKTDINNADEITDKRIMYKTLKQSVDFAASEFKTPYPDLYRSGTTYDLDAHYSMRPIEITSLRGIVSVEILNNISDKSPISSTLSWLKLSTFSNYTAAYRANLNSNPTALATSITLDATIPGLFRLYLYNDEWNEYVAGDPDVTKRSLYLRFTFETSPGVKDVYTARMDQRAGFYMGKLGGEFTVSSARSSYNEGLALESVIEASTQYLSYYPSSYNVNFAYTDINEADIIKSHGYDIYNGKSATQVMAENSEKISVISKTSTIQKPIYNGDHVDLYQYKYYTGDGFAQRYCYDKNRDNNGNGFLDPDEIVWYLPSWMPIVTFALNYYSTQPSYSYIQNVKLMNSTFYTTSVSAFPLRGGISLIDMGGSFDTNAPPRCVRNVPLKSKGNVEAVYYEEDGYAVIDASALMSDVVEDRVNNPSLITADGRTKRYYFIVNRVLNPIEQKVSVRFRVAPTDIIATGEPNMTGKAIDVSWADAAGYNAAINTQPIVEGVTSDIANTGCPMYRGKDGTDDPDLVTNRWRLPTYREQYLIAIMNPTMAATNANTGYKGQFGNTGNWQTAYRTAAEIADIGSFSKNNSAALSVTVKYNGKPNQSGNPNLRSYISVLKSLSTSDSSYPVRCIQDLPAK